MTGQQKPSPTEFEVKDNAVIHKPTSAMWTAHAGRPEPRSYRASLLGSVLENGKNYDEGEVKAMALRLLAERPSLKDWKWHG